jgi:hypothetical protein
MTVKAATKRLSAIMPGSSGSCKLKMIAWCYYAAIEANSKCLSFRDAVNKNHSYLVVEHKIVALMPLLNSSVKALPKEVTTGGGPRPYWSGCKIQSFLTRK